MSTIATLKSWSNAEVLTHTDLNSNFSAIRTPINTYGMFTDVNRTVTANLIFNPAAGVGITVSTGGITVTGASTITGTLGGLTGLTVASGGAAITGNSTITGTLTGLTGLTVASGGATITGNSTITGTLGSLTGLSIASGAATSASQPRCHITNAAGSISTVGAAALTFDTEVLDVGSMWAVGNASRFVASTAGSYQITFTGVLGNDADVTANIKLRKNGLTDYGSTYEFSLLGVTVGGTHKLPVSVTWQADLALNDYVEVMAWAGGGTATHGLISVAMRQVW